MKDSYLKMATTQRAKVMSSDIYRFCLKEGGSILFDKFTPVCVPETRKPVWVCTCVKEYTPPHPRLGICVSICGHISEPYISVALVGVA